MDKKNIAIISSIAIVALLLAFSLFQGDKKTTGNSDTSQNTIKNSADSNNLKWKRGWNKSHIMDYISECSSGCFGNQDIVPCSEFSLLCKCEIESMAYSFSHSDWEKYYSEAGVDLISPNITMSSLENRLSYLKECHYDNNLISSFSSGMLLDYEERLNRFKAYGSTED